MAFLPLTLNIRQQIAYRGVPLPNVWLLSLLMGHRKSTNVDAIDSFISELVENKELKWKILNNKQRPSLRKTLPQAVQSATGSGFKSSSFRLTQIFDDLTSNPLVINIDSLEQSHIDNLVETAINEGNGKDVHLLFDQMVEYQKLPSHNVLNMIFKYFASTTDRYRLEQITELCIRVDPELTAKCSNFLHYKALLQWKSGNSLNSLMNFKEALTSCSTETKNMVINRLLREMVDETIGRKSEAVLLAVIEMGEFCMQKLQDDFLLCYVWESSFQSQWYSDQEAARSLFDKHSSLRQVIAKRLTKLCFTFMQELNTEPVYRLMELFLKHDMLPQCRQILIRLFEYQYWRRDLRACSEIMQNSIDLDIPLPDIYNRKLLDLLLGRSDHQLRPQLGTDAKQKEKLQAKKYELKF